VIRASLLLLLAAATLTACGSLKCMHPFAMQC